MRSLVFWILVLGVACAPPSFQADWHLHGARVYADAGVVLGALEESVIPQNEASVPERALLVPLVMEADAAHRRALATGLTGTLCDVWRAMGVFAALEFHAGERVTARDEALALARSKGASVLLWGRLNPVLVGGGLGRTEIGVRLETIWVPTGQTYWMASQAGVIEGGYVRDYVLAKREIRLPRHPEAALMAALAESLASAYLAHGSPLGAALP